MEDRIEGVSRGALGHVQDAVGGLVGDAGLQAKGKINEVTGTVQEAYGKAFDRVDGAIDGALSQAEEAYGELARTIRDKPLLAVGLAVLGGALLWRLVSGRKVVYVSK